MLFKTEYYLLFIIKRSSINVVLFKYRLFIDFVTKAYLHGELNESLTWDYFDIFVRYDITFEIQLNKYIFIIQCLNNKRFRVHV